MNQLGNLASVSRITENSYRHIWHRNQADPDFEAGWKDVEAGRVSDFNPQDVKRRGRERLSRTASAGPPRLPAPERPGVYWRLDV